jgi:hypothetical protein
MKVDGGTLDLPITDPSSRAVPLTPRHWRQKLLEAENSKLFQDFDTSKKDDTGNPTRRPVLLLDVRNGRGACKNEVQACV